MTETTSTPFTSYAIQKALNVTVDGKWGPETEAAMREALGNPKDNTGRPWKAKRLIVGFQQKLMREAGIDVGIDGLIGPSTLHAFELYQDWLRKKPEDQPIEPMQANVFGSLQLLWNRWWNPLPAEGKVVVATAKPAPPAPSREPKIVAPVPKTLWPRQRDVPSFFGAVGTNQTVITCPWQMQLAWDAKVKTNRITLHQKVAPSAQRALNKIFDHYGEEGVRKLGLHRFGGSLNVRKVRGGNSWSMHSWGIAIDWDPDNNEMRTNHTKARLAKEDAVAFWDIWESEGWVSLGRERDFDWMHVQAARL